MPSEIFGYIYIMTTEAKKVAVQYGHIFRNNIHNTADWCMYLKGGSSYFRVKGNELYNTGLWSFHVRRSIIVLWAWTLIT